MANKKNQYLIEESGTEFDVNNYVSLDTSFPHTQLPNFKFSDNSVIEGIAKTETWQTSITGRFFIDKDLADDLTRSGDSPKFNQIWKKESSGDVKIYIKNSTLYIGNKSFTADNFRDSTLPNRLIVVLQAGGGGGGSNSQVYAGGWCIGGSNGGAGGAGCCIAVIINTEVLKTTPTNYYIVHIGAGGYGPGNGNRRAEGQFWFGNGVNANDPGGAGEDSYIKYKDITLITAHGGGGGGRGWAYDNGSPGAGGGWTIGEGSGTYWWPCPCTSPDGTFHDSCFLQGASGGSYQHAGNATGKYKPRAISKSNFYKKLQMYIEVGGFKGGSAGQGESPGGGASWFANGGDGGGAAERGKNGSKGSGGGGGRFTYGGFSITGIAGLAAMRGGGTGGTGCAYIYY